MGRSSRFGGLWYFMYDYRWRHRDANTNLGYLTVTARPLVIPNRLVALFRKVESSGYSWLSHQTQFRIEAGLVFSL